MSHSSTRAAAISEAEQRRPGSVERRLPLLLFAGAVLLSGVTALKGIQPNDEGLMLRAAARIADGQVPYRDFWWYYPPGQPYLLGGLWAIFGPSLLPWRIVRVLADASVAVLAYSLARRYAGPRLSLAAWLAAALAMAFPSGPHPYPLSLALALAALLAFERRPLVAGLLVGLCGAWRIEFAGFAALGILAAYAVGPAAGRERARAAGRFAAAALLTGLALYLPIVLAAGLSDSWELLVRYPLLEFRKYQGLPLRFRYDDLFSLASPRAAVDTLGALLHFYLPLALIAGALVSAARLALSFTRARFAQVASVLFAAGMTSYLLVRPDFFHTAPLEVMVAVLAVWAIAAPAGRRAGVWWVRAATAAGVVAALALAFVIADGTDHRVRGIGERTVALHAPAADGVRALPSQAPTLDAAVRYVRARVPPGRPIYLTGRRADFATAGNPLFYVLAERPNPTRYDIAAPGVVTSAPVQRQIIGVLSRRRPLVVRWASPLTDAPEPNRAGRSSGVRLLDAFLAARYRQAARFGDYIVLVPRGA